MPWMIVEWSLPPKSWPITSSESEVMVLQRYMAICLGRAISLLLVFEIIWSTEMWKCSETTSMMSCDFSWLVRRDDIGKLPLSDIHSDVSMLEIVEG